MTTDSITNQNGKTITQRAFVQRHERLFDTAATLEFLLEKMSGGPSTALEYRDRVAYVRLLKSIESDLFDHVEWATEHAQEMTDE